MSVKTHHVAVSLILSSFALAALAWLGVRAPVALATCSTGANIVLTAPSLSSTLSGTTTLSASTAGSSAQPQAVTFLITAPSQIALGDATSPTGSGASWSFSWDSRTVPDGGYQFAAVAHYGSNSTYDCLSASVPGQVYNSSATGNQPTLAASISPGSWAGVPGQKQNFSVTGVFTDPLGQQHPVTASSGAGYQWTTNAGSLSANGGPSITLTDGPATGNFMVNVVVSLNGLSVTKQVPVKIGLPGFTSPPSSSSAGSISTSTSPALSGSGVTTPLTPQQLAILQSTPTIFNPVAPSNSNPVVPVQTLGCLLEKLGSKYTAISSGQTQPTLGDKLTGDTCFSGSAKIPSTLAPVQPAQITDLPTATDVVSLDAIKNETITSKDGSKVTAILMSGSSTPNASVFLYIFSDPMVLRAQSDSQGKWSYVLENPLKPGHHEFYAVSQQDAANFVRTPAVPVSIAAAAQDSRDGSLVIEHSLQPVQVGYIAASTVMALAGLILLLRLSRRRFAHPVPLPAVAMIQPTGPPPAPAAQAVQLPDPAPPPQAPASEAAPQDHENRL